MSILQLLKNWWFGPGHAEAAGERKARAQLEQLIALHNRARKKKMGRDDWRGAIRDLDRVIAQLPTSGEAYFDRGTCHLQRGNAAAARVDLSRAIALVVDQTTRGAAYLNRAEALSQLGDLRGAIADTEAARRLVSGRQPFATSLPRVLERFERMLAERPATAPAESPAVRAEAAQKLGWSLKERGALVDALVAFDEAVALVPDELGARRGRGAIRCMLGLHAAALADLDRVIELAPRDVRALAERGIVHAERGAFDRAMSDYDLALEVDPGYAVAHFNKGSAFALQERWSEAMPYFDRAIELHAEVPAAFYFNRGRCHEELGHRRAALDDLSRYMRMTPDGSMAALARKTIARLERAGAN